MSRAVSPTESPESRKSTPSPSLYYSLTHAHRSAGYRNQTQPLTESTTRLIYLRVYDIWDIYRNPHPPHPYPYSLTHTHRSTGYHNQTQPLTESTMRLMHLRVHEIRDSSRKPAPPRPWYSLTHAHRSIGYHNQIHPVWILRESNDPWFRQLYLQVTYDFFSGFDV